ncbi:MAG: oxidoreductase [Planctomycetes bacterium]|nr:oxidoreductase [Planctomycetota bacterium]
MLWYDKHHVEIQLGNWVKIQQHGTPTGESEAPGEAGNHDTATHDTVGHDPNGQEIATHETAAGAATAGPADEPSAGGEEHHHLYHFSVKVVFDRLSVPFAILSFVLSGTIGAFASQYVHREPGFNRFFVLYAIFVQGMVLTALAGTIETLFTGWEMVGLSSILLVAFYQERPAPPRNALWVWVVYRVSDAALLLAAVVMHHLKGEGDFDRFLGQGEWPRQVSALDPQQALIVGLLLLVAIAGKSALVPFSGWLPRAMEGPTPSSAVFYGALSVHLGAFLLLRISPLLDVSPVLSVAVVMLGLMTAIVAHMAGGVQTDIKSALSFASLVQVGIIVSEIGLGMRYVPLIHLLGHACLRTLQFIRAPTLLQDYRTLENAIGEHLPHGQAGIERYRIWLYRWSIERAYLDSILSEYILYPFLRIFRWCDGMERRWTDFLSRGTSRDSDQVQSAAGGIDELA